MRAGSCSCAISRIFSPTCTRSRSSLASRSAGALVEALADAAVRSRAGRPWRCDQRPPTEDEPQSSPMRVAADGAGGRRRQAGDRFRRSIPGAAGAAGYYHVGVSGHARTVRGQGKIRAKQSVAAGADSPAARRGIYPSAAASAQPLTERSGLKSLLEACLFVASDPIVPADIAKLFEVDEDVIAAALGELAGGVRCARWRYPADRPCRRRVSDGHAA